jgi:hypothetical protein
MNGRTTSSLRAAASLIGVAVGAALVLWACSSSTTSSTTSKTDAGGASGDAASQDGDGAADSGMGQGTVDAGPPMCDAAIVECVTIPTKKSPTINVPSACSAPAFDAYSTTDNEQLTAMCNDFCVQQNPAYVDAGGFVGCNQSPAEQALGTGAFHCVCAP